MSQLIVLDTGVLGMLVHPSEAGEPHECKAWLKQLVLRDASVHIPEIADYELRRDLLRMKSDESVRRLDALKARLTYVPITTAAMLKSAEHWAAVRGAGRPTADDKALDGDLILAAQSALLTQPGDELTRSRRQRQGEQRSDISGVRSREAAGRYRRDAARRRGRWRGCACG